MLEENVIERLEVSDFLCIKHFELFLKRFNVLIGAQATGKSIAAKLLFFFKSMFWDTVLSYEEDQSAGRRAEQTLSRFTEYFPRSAWGMKRSFCIRYDIGKEYVVITGGGRGKSEPRIRFSPFFRETSANLARLRRRFGVAKGKPITGVPGQFWEARNALIERARNKIARVASFGQIYIPAGRSFFAILRENIFRFLESSKVIDPFLTAFGTTYEGLRHHLTSPYGIRSEKRARRVGDLVDPLVQKILCGKYVEENGKRFLHLPDGRRVDIAYSSSGQQEALPLAIIFKVFALSGLGGSTVYIEEPEAHLFPTSQKHIVELLATVFNMTNRDMQLLITTHSPYILTAINNLLLAGRVAEETKGRKLKRALEMIVPPERFLRAQDVSAYTLGEGKATSLVDEEEGILKAPVIDEVSGEIAEEFDKILGLES